MVARTATRAAHHQRIGQNRCRSSQHFDDTHFPPAAMCQLQPVILRHLAHAARSHVHLQPMPTRFAAFAGTPYAQPSSSANGAVLLEPHRPSPLPPMTSTARRNLGQPTQPTTEALCFCSRFLALSVQSPVFALSFFIFIFYISILLFPVHTPLPFFFATSFCSLQVPSALSAPSPLFGWRTGVF